MQVDERSSSFSSYSANLGSSRANTSSEKIKQGREESGGWLDWAKNLFVDRVIKWQISPNKALYLKNCDYLKQITKGEEGKANLVELSETLADQIWEHVIKEHFQAKQEQKEQILLGIQSMFVHALGQMAKNSGIEEALPAEEIVSKIVSHLIETMEGKIKASTLHKSYMELSISLIEGDEKAVSTALLKLKTGRIPLKKKVLRQLAEREGGEPFQDLLDNKFPKFQSEQEKRAFLQALSEAHLRCFFTGVAETLLIQAFPGKGKDEGFINIVQNLLGENFLNGILKNFFNVPKVSWSSINSLIGDQLYDFFLASEKILHAKTPTLDGNEELKSLIDKGISTAFTGASEEAKALYEEKIENQAQESEKQRPLLIDMKGVQPKVNKLLSDTLRRLLVQEVEDADEEIETLKKHLEHFSKALIYKFVDHMLGDKEGQAPEERALEIAAELFDKLKEGFEEIQEGEEEAEEAAFAKLAEKLLESFTSEELFYNNTPKIAESLGLWHLFVDLVAIQSKALYEAFYSEVPDLVEEAKEALNGKEKEILPLFQAIENLARDALSETNSQAGPILDRLLQAFFSRKELPEGIDPALVNPIKEALFGKEGYSRQAALLAASGLAQKSHLLSDETLIPNCFLHSLQAVSKYLDKGSPDRIGGLSLDDPKAFYQQVGEKLTALLFPDAKNLPVPKALQEPSHELLKKASALILESTLEPLEDPERRNAFLLEKVLKSNNRARAKLGKKQAALPLELIETLSDRHATKEKKQQALKKVKAGLSKELGRTASLQFQLAYHTKIRNLFGRKRAPLRFLGRLSQIAAAPFLSLAAFAIGLLAKRAAKQTVENVLNHQNFDEKLVRLLIWDFLEALERGRVQDKKLRQLDKEGQRAAFKSVIHELAKEHELSTLSRFPKGESLLASLLFSFTESPAIPFFTSLLEEEKDPERVYKPLFGIV